MTTLKQLIILLSLVMNGFSFPNKFFCTSVVNVGLDVEDRKIGVDN